MFRLAEHHSGYTRKSIVTDGMTKDETYIAISIFFPELTSMNLFQGEVIEFITVCSGDKRPVVEVDEAQYLDEWILIK